MSAEDYNWLTGSPFDATLDIDATEPELLGRGGSIRGNFELHDKALRKQSYYPKYVNDAGETVLDDLELNQYRGLNIAAPGSYFVDHSKGEQGPLYREKIWNDFNNISKVMGKVPVQVFGGEPHLIIDGLGVNEDPLTKSRMGGSWTPSAKFRGGTMKLYDTDADRNSILQHEFGAHVANNAVSRITADGTLRSPSVRLNDDRKAANITTGISGYPTSILSDNNSAYSFINDRVKYAADADGGFKSWYDKSYNDKFNEQEDGLKNVISNYSARLNSDETFLNNHFNPRGILAINKGYPYPLMGGEREGWMAPHLYGLNELSEKERWNGPKPGTRFEDLTDYQKAADVNNPSHIPGEFSKTAFYLPQMLQKEFPKLQAPFSQGTGLDQLTGNYDNDANKIAMANRRSAAAAYDIKTNPLGLIPQDEEKNYKYSPLVEKETFNAWKEYQDFIKNYPGQASNRNNDPYWEIKEKLDAWK